MLFLVLYNTCMMPISTARLLLPSLLLTSLLLSACGEDDLTSSDPGVPGTETESIDSENGPDAPGTETNNPADETDNSGTETVVPGTETENSGTETEVPDSETDSTVIEAGPTTASSDSAPFSLALDTSVVEIIEGEDTVSVTISIDRDDDFDGDVLLSVATPDESDANQLERQLSDEVLSVGESDSSLQIDLAIGRLPLQIHSRTLVVTASDDNGESLSLEVLLQVQPTGKPDVYLLIGQSNMVGNSEDGAKQAGSGELDEPVERLKQLNVTFNDISNFSTAADFSNPESSYNIFNPITIAQDPLHVGLQSNGDKNGTRIGPGLSFGKRALEDTTADIVLVPAAWSGSGFCDQGNPVLPELGWNASATTNSALGGTLLHDRAIVRINSTLELTGGILRGILWHQGEQDSDDRACAESYGDNLLQLIQSLRQNIALDARGPAARGQDADIAFILGTMSMGGEQAPFSETKSLVDSVHRNIAQLSDYTDFVNNDDLLPPAFGCGSGSCIHFGSAAVREMGQRYYERLLSVLSQ